MLKRALAVAGFLMLCGTIARGADPGKKVLILYDEKPAMEILAKRLAAEGFGADYVSTKEKLPELTPYYAVVVYIHGQFPAAQADAVIAYTQQGGRMLGLHHTISSGKVKTPQWLKFMGVAIEKGDLEKGGYGWEEGGDLKLINIAPGHYITTHNVKYVEKTEYKRSDVDEPARERDCIDFPESEVYVNHRYTDGKEKTILFGFKSKTLKLGDKVWMQDRGGWLKRAGKGWIFYFMAGHNKAEFENPVYQQVIVNCLTWNP